MDITLFPHPTPFMMMASSDYSPYPLHTAQGLSPRRRRNTQSTSSTFTARSPTPSYLGASPPRRRELYVRNHYTSTTSEPVLRGEYNGPTTSRRYHATKSSSTRSAPRPARIDSGFDDNASGTSSAASSITFTEEVERRFALRQYYLQMQREGEDLDRTEDDEEEMGGELGRMARDSIDINVSRAGTWESKESRRKRNQGSKFRMVKRWVGGLLRL